MGDTSCVAITATMNDASVGSANAAITNATRTAIVVAVCKTTAASRDAPSCHAIAPGVAFCGDATGSDTRVTIAANSGQASAPVNTSASAASTTSVSIPASTAVHRRWSSAQP